MEPTLTGVQLDFDKITQDEWTLYLTGGQYLNFNQLRTVEPGIIHLREYDFEELLKYNVYYNPNKNQYNIIKEEKEPENICSYYGLHLGSFVIQGCSIKWQYPEDGCVKYVRGFSDGFNAGFEDKINKDKCEDGCKSFSIEFTTEFNTETTPCDNTGCDLSIGGERGTEFILDGYLLPNCPVAVIDCAESIGGESGTEFIPENRLYSTCTIAKV